MSSARDRILLALDAPTEAEALKLVSCLGPHVGGFKVGLELVHAAGLNVLERVRDAGAARVFYDVKLHDIPNTVQGAMAAIGKRGAWMTNLHASGGLRMMAAGAKAARESAAAAGLPAPLVIAVTVLTSLSADELNDEVGVPFSPEEQVVRLATLAQEAGVDGVVASPHEIEAIRAACGPNFLIVTPGVRPAGTDAGDQRRVMTPGEAIRKGADYLVIGRAITGADDPVAAAQGIEAEIAGVLG